MENEGDIQPSSKPVLATKTKNATIRATEASAHPTQRTIVILGVERGGTSMVAGVIRALGVDLGKAAGLNHEDPWFLSDDPEVLKDRVAKRNETADVWGFKMPKAVKQLEFWDKTLRNPVYIIVYRNPLAIADSWVQRGTGTLLGALKRIREYHSAALNFLEATQSPVLMVNYERAVQDEMSGRALVQELSSFLELSASPDQEKASLGMITGDGGGYVDLPETYFAMQRAEKAATTSEIATRPKGDKTLQVGEWFDQTKPSMLAPYLTCAVGKPFPKFLRLECDFQPGDNFEQEHDTMFMFYGVEGQQQILGPKELDLKPGQNFFDVETSGKVTEIAFKSSKTPSRYQLDVRVLEAVVNIVEDDRRWATPAKSKATVGRFKKLKMRFAQMLKG